MKAEPDCQRMQTETRDEPLVSVIMSFHNAQATLLHSIHSLIWQTYQNWELILLDDGSTDGSVEATKTIQDRRIQLHGDGVCRGLATRLNQGVLLSKGQYIARMDADDIAFPERFEKQIAYLQSHDEIDLLATSVLLVNKNNQPLGLIKAGLTHEEICSRPWKGFAMPHPTWMGRAKWFIQNPYDPLAKKAQDQILILQTYTNSRFAGLPDVLLGYRYDAVSLKKSFAGRWHYVHAAFNLAQIPRHSLAYKTMLYHGLVAMRDAFGLLFGLGPLILDGRTNKSDVAILDHWNELQNKFKRGRA